MIVTDKNESLVKSFIDILVHMNCSQEEVGMICAAIQDKSQMDALVDWIEEHTSATSLQVLDKALEIAGNA